MILEIVEIVAHETRSQWDHERDHGSKKASKFEVPRVYARLAIIGKTHCELSFLADNFHTARRGAYAIGVVIRVTFLRSLREIATIAVWATRPAAVDLPFEPLTVHVPKRRVVNSQK